MDDILSDLYTGDLFPPIHYVPQSEEYLKLRQKHSRHYDNFYKTLEDINPDLAKRFVSVTEEQQELFAFDSEETFMGSFCLGARLMIEIFQRNLTKNEV